MFLDRKIMVKKTIIDPFNSEMMKEGRSSAVFQKVLKEKTVSFVSPRRIKDGRGSCDLEEL